MACILCVVLLVSAFFWVAYKAKKFFEIPPLPNLKDTWWGLGEERNVDTSIRPFKIHISDEVLADLQTRLKQTKPFTPPLEGIQFEYGMNTRTLSEILEFWKSSYNWREREDFLNKYPQFKTNIQGLDIHYIHVKPTNTEGKQVLPLLLLHGWPGSIREFYKVIPLLTTPRAEADFVFELVVPSLPGYGFSDPAVRPGLGPVQMAVVLKNLMLRIGFDKFYIQGGDWGSKISTVIATLYPNHVQGLHINFHITVPFTNWKIILASVYPSLFFRENIVRSIYPLKQFIQSIILRTGYFHIQATKPDTLGVGLQESPIGLAAYILEKFASKIDTEGGGILDKFTYTELLDNVMIYWVNNAKTTAIRIYAEAMSHSNRALAIDKIPTEVPTGYARFPREMYILPDTLLKEKFLNLIHTSDMPRGGHFAALEEPQLLADDVWLTVQKIRSFYKNSYTVS